MLASQGYPRLKMRNAANRIEIALARRVSVFGSGRIHHRQLDRGRRWPAPIGVLRREIHAHRAPVANRDRRRRKSSTAAGLPNGRRRGVGWTTCAMPLGPVGHGRLVLLTRREDVLAALRNPEGVLVEEAFACWASTSRWSHFVRPALSTPGRRFAALFSVHTPVRDVASPFHTRPWRSSKRRRKG